MFHVSLRSDNSTFTPWSSLFSSLCTSLALNHTLGNVWYRCNKRASFFFVFFFKQTLLNFVFSASKTEDDTETKADGGEDKDESNKVSSSLEA